jgi:CRISPR-associated exonuclease Cas4
MAAAMNPGTGNEDDLAPISSLQHMLYCPRQCALIHTERQWADNRFTAEGTILHGRADSGSRERRTGVRIERSVALRSLQLGVSGIADVVEMHDGGRPYPVEYKRGRPKTHRADEVQLCAQAICLEEMLGTRVPEGALFYGRNRRRRVVTFDAGLRALTERVAADTRRMLATGQTPPPEYEARKCSACSLKEACQPQSPRRAGTVDRWLIRAIES